MTAAKITDLHTDTGEDRFVIPKHRRDTLPMFTGFSQVLPVLAQVTDELTNCFKKDGPSGEMNALLYKASVDLRSCRKKKEGRSSAELK